MKQAVSPPLRKQVLDLRRSHSFAEVAKLSGLPIGTVKTICSRSGVFRDNPTHRYLFSLPAIKESLQTALAVPDLPKKQSVTGDNEVDAVIWLRQVISTGQCDLIQKAMECAKEIKTPLKELEDRYTKHLVSANPGNWTVGFKTIGFDDLDGLAKSSIDKLAKQNEAQARFGDAIFSDTDAESFCIGALADLPSDGNFGRYDADKAAARFKARPEVMPNTLSDCIHELSFWHSLYCLRKAATPHGEYAPDFAPEVNARDDFVFRCLAKIRPRTKDESIAVFHYLAENDCMGREETNDILLSLMQ